MNKKFLSAILFGAMLVTAIGTFVSCKDYDDDIEDLQNQINSLTTSSSSLTSNLSSVQSTLESELSSAQSSLQSQITSAQSALQSAIDNKADASEISTLASNLSTLQQNYEAKTATLDAQIAAAQTAIEALQAAGSNEEALQEAIDAANATLSALTGTIDDESKTREAVDATLQIQLDALNAFQAAVEAADYQAQIDALSQYIEGDDSAESIAGLTEQIEAVKAELEEAIASNTTSIAELTEMLQEISDSLIDINPNLDAVTLLVEAGVTSVELVISYTADNLPDCDLSFKAAIVQANVFVPGIENYIEFNAGDLVQVPATFVVRVSPVNATLTPDMIHFVNSQGEDLDDMVTVTGVDKYKDLLTVTKAAASGLYTISAQLIDGTAEEDFEAKTQITNDDETTSKVLYAVQINNTLAAYADRYATSTYDLTMVWEPYTGANSLTYTVGDKDVADLNNRYQNTGTNPSLEYTDTESEITYTELGWLGDAAVAAITDGDDQNADDDSGDDRSDLDLYEAQVGEPITITIYETDEDGKTIDPENIRAMYVALDFEENAIESAPSEWNAWTKYSYTGLNTVVENEDGKLSTTITVNSSEANNDIIGFRVFAVNYDGTLVDPDGKAFYVVLGSQSTNWGEAETTITPVADDVYSTKSTVDDLDLSGVSLSNAAAITWVTDQLDGTAGDDTTTPIFNIVMTNSKGVIVAYTHGGKLYDADGNEADSDTDLSSVTNVYTTVLDDPTTTAGAIYTWVNYIDDQEYTGTLTFTNSKDRTIGTITVTMTKTLPTGLPYNATVKTNQLVNGKYYAFMVPSNDGENVTWSASATYGTMAMKSVFNYENDDADILSHYQITWYDSVDDPDGEDMDGDEKADDKPVDGAGTLAVDISYVDNKTYHNVTVGWNYGLISSATPTEDYIAIGYSFEAMYVCLYYENVYTWAWADDATTSIQYAATDFTLDLNTIVGTSLKDSQYNATADGGYENSLTIESATLTTVEDPANPIESEYFTIEVNGSELDFTPVSVDTDTTGDVASELTLTGTDCYGHTVTITLPMTVTKR